MVVAPCVEEPPRASVPSSPAVGACYLVAGNPEGDWSNFAGHLAAFTAGGWRFAPPVEGMQAWVRSAKVMAQFIEGAWNIGTVSASRIDIGGKQVVSDRGAAIAGPAGGSIIDTEARNAIHSILGRLRAHGLIAAT